MMRESEFICSSREIFIALDVVENETKEKVEHRCIAITILEYKKSIPDQGFISIDLPNWENVMEKIYK